MLSAAQTLAAARKGEIPLSPGADCSSLAAADAALAEKSSGTARQQQEQQGA